MIQVIFRPLDTWPTKATPSHHRRGSRHFKASWTDTLDLLERELSHLAAKDIVIQIETDLSQIRNDGWPRSDAKVLGPKVAIFFQSKFGMLTYRCDDCVLWIHNVRCIAMTLERLRMAEMYGVTKRGEQYQGFKALPAGAIPVGPIKLTAEEAAQVLNHFSFQRIDGVREILGDRAFYAQAYRLAVKKLHPDCGGNRAEWDRLQEAVSILQDHMKAG